jgi:hypothetical protein
MKTKQTNLSIFLSYKYNTMKKIIVSLALICSVLAFGQETNEKKSTGISDRKHEIKVGAIKLLAGPIFEGTYEYIYSKDFTFGSSMLIDLQKDNAWDENFSLTPFARFYFQETKEYGAKGFFAEGFLKIAAGETELYEELSLNNTAEKFTAAALGLSVGRKWVNHSGFVFETLIGLGRTLGNSDHAPDVFFRGDLSLGYRF